MGDVKGRDVGDGAKQSEPAGRGEGQGGGGQGGGGRIAVLDVIRGIAILGTFGTNVWIFTDPAGISGFLDDLPTGDSVTGMVEQFLRFAANGKFLALLSLMFGVGLELQYRSARRRGYRWPGWYLWRAALLFVEGLVHYLLVFEGDVLMAYALTSLLVAYLVGRGDRAVRWWIGVLAAGHVAVMSLITFAMVAGQATVSGGPAAATDRYTDGSWFEQIADRVTGFFGFRAEIVIIVPLGTVLFLLGSRLLRAGLFDDDAAGARLRRRLMLLGLGIGLPVNLFTAYAGPAWFFLDRYVAPPLVALGLLALIPALVFRARRAPGVVHRGLEAVGRMALSCYVLQNVVAMVVCYGWGLRLAERFDGARPWWPVVLWVVVCAAFMAFASWWMRGHDRGPMELVMHRAYLAPRRRGGTVRA